MYFIRDIGTVQLSLVNVLEGISLNDLNILCIGKYNMLNRKQ